MEYHPLIGIFIFIFTIILSFVLGKNTFKKFKDIEKKSKHNLIDSKKNTQCIAINNPINEYFKKSVILIFFTPFLNILIIMQYYLKIINHLINDHFLSNISHNILYFSSGINNVFRVLLTCITLYSLNCLMIELLEPSN